jgi:short-subunit dehydrogenase
MITESGGKAYVFPADLSSSEARATLAENILSELGSPDILINNVGIGWYGYFSQMPWDVAKELINLNISTTTHLTSIFLPHMLTLPKARIINIGSIAGKLPEQGIALYSASKAYLDAFSKSLFRELRGTNTTISVVRSGPVKTDFFDRSQNLAKGRRIPGELFAVKPERVSRCVWWLLQNPVRYAYVPFYLFISPLLEIFFSWIIDLIGPVLLRNSSKHPTTQSGFPSQ